MLGAFPMAMSPWKGHLKPFKRALTRLCLLRFRQQTIQHNHFNQALFGDAAWLSPNVLSNGSWAISGSRTGDNISIACMTEYFLDIVEDALAGPRLWVFDPYERSLGHQIRDTVCHRRMAPVAKTHGLVFSPVLSPHRYRFRVDSCITFEN
jgi:hypothetical protein